MAGIWLAYNTLRTFANEKLRFHENSPSVIFKGTPMLM